MLFCIPSVHLLTFLPLWLYCPVSGGACPCHKEGCQGVGMHMVLLVLTAILIGVLAGVGARAPDSIVLDNSMLIQASGDVILEAAQGEKDEA